MSSTTLPRRIAPASGPPDAAPRRRGRGNLRSTLWWAFFVLLLALLVLRPLVQLQERALADGARGLLAAFSLPTIGRVLATTAALGVGATVVAVLLGVVLALSATMLPRGTRWMASLPIVPLVVPPVAAIIGWLFLLAPNVGYLNTALRTLPGLDGLSEGPLNIYSPTWIILITGITLSPFVFLFAHTSLRDMGGEYQDAAAACGGGLLRTLRTVTLPLLRPSIAYSAGIVVLLALGQFNAPLLLGAPRASTSSPPRCTRSPGTPRSTSGSVPGSAPP